MIGHVIQYAALFLGTALLLGAVNFVSLAGRLAPLNARRKHLAADVLDARNDFEVKHHLLVPPPVGTTVALVKHTPYIAEYHGAGVGDLGTVIRHSRLNANDNGVLVNWGIRPNDMVRMDLEELRLAPAPEPGLDRA